MNNNKVRAIAFYLPQFYPTPENDEWWEPGFTEWTNVARAKPLFEGHYQPRIPRDLGFYDLRVPETREKQAELAREAGIEGFCYWHYWFGNGKRLLDRVFREVVESGKPDFPFCLCWANHSWYSKTWDHTKPDILLIEQTYPGEEDYIAHFYEMLPAFKDKRYIRINGKLLFGVFEPSEVCDGIMFKIWNDLAQKEGIGSFHFFALIKGSGNFTSFNRYIYDSVVLDPLVDTTTTPHQSHERFKREKLLKQHKPYIQSYDSYITNTLNIFSKNKTVYPCIVPDFDHSPRSSYRGQILQDSCPEKWGTLLNKTIDLFSNRPYEENLLFIKAWNEWAEGNYLEPDQKFGKRYIEEIAKVIKTTST